MTQLTSDQVRHIAKLARLQLTDAEVEKFGPQLTSILGYIDSLSEVDTKNVEPTAQVTGITNALRADDIRTNGPTPDELLGCSPLTVVDHQIATPSAHG